MRILAVGDIHGNYKGLIQALERSSFDNENDTLISLGDVVDGHSESYEVVEKLLSIKNLISIKGNHDDWFLQWIETGDNPTEWRQGQKATGLSYLKHLDPSLSWFTFDKENKKYIITLRPNDVPQSHKKFFRNQLPYHIDKNNNLFIHGGFNRHYPLEDQDPFIFWWDRDLWYQALSYRAMGEPRWMPKFKMVGDYNEVFIGHTSTQFWNEDKPMKAANIWNLDTGGGWYGYVTIMDINTKEYWQSDSGKDLYPEFKGR